MAAVIEMRVRENDSVDRRGVDREGFPVELAKLTEALKHSTIDEESLAAPFNEMPRAGHRPRGTQERKAHLSIQAEALASRVANSLPPSNGGNAAILIAVSPKPLATM